MLANNAGINPFYKRAEHTGRSEWQQIIDVNLTGVFFACKHAGRAMRHAGAYLSKSANDNRRSAASLAIKRAPMPVWKWRTSFHASKLDRHINGKPMRLTLLRPMSAECRTATVAAPPQCRGVIADRRRRT
ncbi:SDR family oxidoreductase [Paracoccus mutanolyticus]|uniref:SDR family oxidoreductase n=1 Tax=Paracoccus mutanolyticus TaxID=1499308 RepID=UPI001CB9A653